MAVYREAFEAIKTIEVSTTQVFEDACDAGAWCSKGDKIWEAVKTLHQYKMPEDKEYKDSDGGYFEIEVMNEWAVSDGEMTVEEASINIRVHYCRLKDYQNKPYLNNMFKGADGYVYVEQFRNSKALTFGV